jgi:glycosyltransferase involved in cell wall biosynthesis
VDASRERAGRYGRAAGRWARLLVARQRRGPEGPGSDEARVFYGHDTVPGPDEPARGGTAKFQRLSTRFPNRPTDFDLLYLGSTWLPRDLRQLLWLARRRRVPVVLNQNGVGYPAWAGAETDAVNAPLRRALHAADHVLYQSEFCKRSADRYLGEPRGGWEILANAVDTDRFSPAATPPRDGPVFLLAGDQLQPYRLELALRTLQIVRRSHEDARLLVLGRVEFPPPASLLDGAELLGRYAQSDAPILYRRAHVLLHTTVNDSCPSAVIEAMACGLPVVYPASGGTVELVGDDAGIGLPHPESWERVQPPEPEALAEALERVLADRGVYAVAARRRAVENYSLGPWLERHGHLFADLLGRG